MAIGNDLDLRAPGRQQLLWENMTPGEKKHTLYLRQVDLLKTFRSRNAITQAQYDKSLRDLAEKMGEALPSK